MSTDDYIVITGSHNLDEDKNIDEAPKTEEGEPSTKTLEKQGIFIDRKDKESLNVESHDDFSKILQEVSGIEILVSEDEETKD